MVESRELAAPELRVPDLTVQDFPPVQERRRHPRYLCDGHAEVLLPQGGLLFRGRILDLSVSGCFIETTMPNLERGTLVEVFFVAPSCSSGSRAISLKYGRSAVLESRL